MPSLRGAARAAAAIRRSPSGTDAARRHRPGPRGARQLARRERLLGAGRRVVLFIADHPTLCGGGAFHCYSGVLLRPLSYQSDDDMSPEDLWGFRTIGAEGTRLTGYPAASAYHEFRYHPKEIITGALDDWLYEQQGVFAWTVEIWSPQREAGIGEYRFIDWYRDHPVEDDLKLL